MRELVDDLLPQIARELGRQGWTFAPNSEEEDYAFFFMSKFGGLIYCVGLDLTPRDFGLSLNPSVSVRHETISRLSAQFYGLAEGASIVGASLADLFNAQGRESGFVPRWSVFPSDDIAVVARVVASDIERYGGPFLGRFTSLAEVVLYLEEREPKSRFDLGHLAIAYAEAGDMSRCESIIVRFSSSIIGQPPFVAEQAEQFVTNIRRHYGLRDEG
ncbi:hypothetical protein ACIQH6_18975 [Micromonospora orduensis]|uniref:hypothetical protein n=1 Tax=Micromonospora orduensis TaxID=1420891 RepID=UPI003815C341